MNARPTITVGAKAIITVAIAVPILAVAVASMMNKTKMMNAMTDHFASIPSLIGTRAKIALMPQICKLMLRLSTSIIVDTLKYVNSPSLTTAEPTTRHQQLLPKTL